MSRLNHYASLRVLTLCALFLQWVTIFGYSSVAFSGETVLEYQKYIQSLNADPISKKQINVMRSVEATAQIRDPSCSGVFVSRDGYMLTALHCLDSLVLDSNYIDELFEIRFKKNDPGSGEILFSKKEGVPRFLNIPLINPKPKVNQDAARSVEIIFLGNSWPKRLPNPGSNQSVLTMFRDNLEDFAVLKFKTLPNGYSCVPVVSSDFSPDGQSIWLTGYPRNVNGNSDPYLVTDYYQKMKNVKTDVEFEELDARLSNGLEQGERWAFDVLHPVFISTGTLFPNYKTLLNKFPDIGNIGLGDQISNAKIYWVSTAPGTSGMSGGGAFSKEGKLLGITVMGALTEAKKYDPNIRLNRNSEIGTIWDFKYGTSLVNLPYIQKTLLNSVGPDMTSKIFSCN